jgi:mannose-6-phosphate isomerase
LAINSMPYPYRFQPLFRRYLWGGRRLNTVLRKPIGSGDDYAESWEIADHGDDQSVVVNGPRKGQSLNCLVQELGPKLLGEAWNARIHADDVPPNLRGRFPLLFKFLDASLPLSVQVHPGDKMASQMSTPDWGKSEAWYVLYADENSRIYAGLHQNIQRPQLARAVTAGAIESTLHSFVPRTGDCIFIPAGTVHAIGGDLLIAEIQQASDTTFRLFDWNRVDSTGCPRELHVAQAMEAIDFRRGPIQPVRPHTGEHPDSQLLVACDKFVLSRWTLKRPVTLGGDQKMRMIAVISGSLDLEFAETKESMKVGHCTLIPAGCSRCELRSSNHAVFLEIHLPE